MALTLGVELDRLAPEAEGRCPNALSVLRVHVLQASEQGGSVGALAEQDQ